MANYPTTLPSSAPATHVLQNDEVVAIATELGVAPSRTNTTVKDRLDLTDRRTIFARTGVVYGRVPGLSVVSWAQSALVAANFPCYFPFRVRETIDITEFRSEVLVAAAASSLTRFGVYTAGAADGQPVALSFDLGTVAVDSTGLKTITTTQTLTPGRYLLCAITTGAPQFTFHSGVSLTGEDILRTGLGNSTVRGYLYGNSQATWVASGLGSATAWVDDVALVTASGFVQGQFPGSFTYTETA